MASVLLNRTLNTISHRWTWWWDVTNPKDQIACATLTVLTLAVAIFWCLRTAKRPKNRNAPSPPGPRGLPVLGYLPFLDTNLHHTFTHLSHVYGPIFQLWLGNKLCVVVSSPSLAKEVVRDQDTTFANRDVTAASQVGTYGGRDLAFAPYGPYWRSMRKLCVRELLSSAGLSASKALRSREVRKTVRDVYAKIGKGVDIGEIAFLTELNVITSCLWGSTQRNDSVGAGLRALFTEGSEVIVMPNVSDIFPALARFDLQGIERKMKRIIGQLEGIFDPIIYQRIKMNNEKEKRGSETEDTKDFLQIMLERKDNEGATASLICAAEIKALFLDIVLGGTDTTATTVEWAMVELLQHPNIYQKVHEELVSMVGLNNIVEETHLPRLQYLDAVVRETLRLHPPLPFLFPRSPSRSSSVGGYTIPQGAAVFLNVWEMHRDPQIWDSPSEFKPERFLSESCEGDYSGNSFHYLPFGSGRRICVGIALAEKMVVFMLASLLHSFEWHLPEGEVLDFSEKSGLVTKKKIPLTAIPTQKLSNLDLYA